MATGKVSFGTIRNLLWTNPTPGTLSAGTINVNMNGYDYIEIECTRGTIGNTYFVKSNIGTNSQSYVVSLTDVRIENDKTGFNSVTIMSRTADVYLAGIVFSSGQMLYDGSLYKDWDNRAAPYRIWGIKN